MRLEHCIRRWLGLKSHYVARIEETPEGIVAEIQEVPNHLPRCGQCGRPVRRTKGRTGRRQWRDLPRCLPSPHLGELRAQGRKRAASLFFSRAWPPCGSLPLLRRRTSHP